MNARRLPGKPLLPVHGRPLVRRVFDAAETCAALDRVVVATDSDAIFDEVARWGAVEMTDANHTSGSDRVAEIARRHADVDVFVNLQGDQLFVTSGMLDTLLKPFSEDGVVMTTLASSLHGTDPTDPNVVKVVCDRRGNALYFSRSQIPFHGSGRAAPILHHLGIYAFTRDFLLQFASLSKTPLEQCEGLEQLRVLEHGYPIRVCSTPQSTVEVNTSEDLVKAETMLSEQR